MDGSPEFWCLLCAVEVSPGFGALHSCELEPPCGTVK